MKYTTIRNSESFITLILNQINALIQLQTVTEINRPYQI